MTMAFSYEDEIRPVFARALALDRDVTRPLAMTPGIHEALEARPPVVGAVAATALAQVLALRLHVAQRAHPVA